MKSITLDDRACYIMLALFLTGSLFAFSGVSSLSNDIWISIIIANIAVIPLCFMYVYLLKTFSNKNFFEILEIIFGKWIGKLIIIIYLLYSTLVSMLNVNSISDYLKYNDLKETPKLFISLFMAFICIKAIMFGINVLGDFCKLLFPFICLAIIVPTLLSYKLFDFYNLLPIISEGYANILLNTVYYFTIPLGEFIIFIVVLNYLKSNNSTGTVLFKGIGISFIISIIVYLRNILVLGPNLISIINYPTYYSTAIIYIGEFFQRFEIFITIILVLSSFVKISVCLFFTLIGIKHLFNLDDHAKLAFPVMLIITSLSTILFQTHSDVNSLVEFYPYVALVFQVLIPLIMTIFTFLTLRKGKRLKNKKIITDS